MLLQMLSALDRHDARTLPSAHRLVLLVLADLADARARVVMDDDAVKRLARRTGLGVREAKRLLHELEFAVWVQREPQHKAKTSPVYVVRCEGGKIHGLPASSADVSEKLPDEARGTVDDLLDALNRGAENEHPWCVKTLQRVLDRGGRLTDNERRRLREIRDEESLPEPRPRRSFGGTSTLQTGGTWKPKGAPP